MPPRRQICAVGGMAQSSGYFWGVRRDFLRSWDAHWTNCKRGMAAGASSILIGKGIRLRTVPVPSWSKQLLDEWLRRSGVSEGRVFRRVSKVGKRQEAGVTANVVWYAVNRCARQAGIANLAPHDLRRTCARLCHDCSGELEQIRFLLGHASVQTTERYIGSKQKFLDAVNDRLGISVT